MIYTLDLCNIEVQEWESIEAAKDAMGYVHPDDTYPTRIKALIALQVAVQEDRNCLQIAIDEAQEAEAMLELYDEELPKIKKEIRKHLLGKSRRKNTKNS